MKSDVSATGTSLTGIAILAACACGTSSGIARVTNSFGYQSSIRSIHPLFVAFAGALIVAGLWARNRLAAMIALCGVLLLEAGEFLTPPMSLSGGIQANAVQISGLLASLFAAALLVYAFFRSYPSALPGSSLMAMSGAAMATGCNCCLITMGLTSLAHTTMPSEIWLTKTLTIYVAGAVLMSIGLARLGGAFPAITAVLGMAFLYFWLELPYSALPNVTIHGANANFVIKYPMMLAGALVVMFGFVMAYREQERQLTARTPLSPAFGD